MSVRLRAILVGAGFLLLVLVWFFVGFRPQQDRINELRDQQEQTEQEIQNLQAQLERLQELQRMEPQLRAQASRLQDALPADPRLPDFILQVQDAANLAGIDFLSISPSLPSAFTPPGDGGGGQGGGDLQAINVSVQTTGRFFALEDFIIRLERLPRAVRIDNFSLSPGGGEDTAPGEPPVLSVTFSMQMFLETVAPVSPDAGTPAPVGTPAPGETPAPEQNPPADETGA